MIVKVFQFLKLFEKQEYAIEFQNGILHASRIAYFRENGYDDFEGVREAPTKNAVVKIRSADGKMVPINSLTSMQIKSDRTQHFNVFCIYARHTGNLGTTISNENIEAMKKQLEISGEVIDTYGEFAVLVTDIEEFVSRVTKALDRCGFKYRGRFVHYYDPENRPRGDNWFDPFETPFFKRDKFKNENEYRFVIEQGTTDPDALKLDIGDIRDISIYMVSREINDRTVVSAD